jgi:dihydrofolate reductase
MNTIVVVDQNWNIGREEGLLAHLPGDLKYFKEKTLGKTLVMGRKTLESLPGSKPLSGRDHIVLTRNVQFKHPDCIVCHTKEQVLEQASGKDVFVAGGEEIYRLFLEDCDTFYVTKIYKAFHADRSFPSLDQRKDMQVTWKSDIREEKTLKFQFFEYKRI